MVGAGGNAPRGRLPRSFRADGFTDRPGDRHPKAFGNGTASRCCPGAARFWRPRCAMLAPAARRTPHAGTRTQTVRFLRPVPLHWATWGRKDCGDRSRTGGARLMRPGGGPPLPANSMIDGAPARYLAGAPSLATTCPDFRPRARKSWPGRGPPNRGRTPPGTGICRPVSDRSPARGNLHLAARSSPLREILGRASPCARRCAAHLFHEALARRLGDI